MRSFYFESERPGPPVRSFPVFFRSGLGLGSVSRPDLQTLLLPDTAQIEGETATRANSGGFTTSIPPKPVKTIADPDSSPKDLLNAPLNAQNDRKLSEIEPNQSDAPKTPEKQPNSSHIPFPHEKPLDNEPEDVENSQLGRGKRARKPGGYYKNLEKGGGGSVAEEIGRAHV